jgi:serine/threonine protein kinase
VICYRLKLPIKVVFFFFFFFFPVQLLYLTLVFSGGLYCDLQWGRDKSDTVRSQMIMEEDGGRLDYLDQELDTAVLQESADDFVSGQRPSPFSGMISTRGKTGMRVDGTLPKEIEVGKSEVEHMDNVGLRPLMGTGSTEEEIIFRGLERSVYEKSAKRSTFDLKESEPGNVYHPPVENPFDGTYTTQLFGDSGRMITISSHGGRDDTGSESKRRKAYELEKCAEEIVSTDHGLEPGLEAGDTGSKVDHDSIADMETDKRLSELEAVRNRILHGKLRKTDSQKRESPSLQSANSIDFTGDFDASRETPTTVTGFLPPLEKDEPPKNKELTVEAEETEKAVRVLGLERVHNGTEGYTREVECAQEGTAPNRSEKEGTIRFWDGDRQRWESPYASDEDTGIKDPFDSKWFAGASGYSRKGGHGLFFDENSCPVDQVPGYYTFGDSEPEDSEQEEGDMTCQTRWYGPPDVRDSYVKGKLEVHEEGSQNEDADDYSREAYGHDERLHDSEVHSQQEETESTYSSESGNKGSNLSPFVGTRWYKGPELLYGATKYGTGLDMWAVGCMFAELLTGKPLFPGITDIDQLSRIVRVFGAPNETIWPGVSSLPDFDKISFSDERDLLSLQKLLPQASPSALKFLAKFLVLDPERRISAEAALRDAFFLEDPLPVISHDLKMPSFRRDSSASEDWGEWRDPGSPFSDFEILDSAP